MKITTEDLVKTIVDKITVETISGGSGNYVTTNRTIDPKKLAIFLLEENIIKVIT